MTRRSKMRRAVAGRRLFARALSALALAAACSPIVAAEAEFRADDVAFFETHVRPVLAARCLKCHGAEKQESDLRLDSRAAALAGGLAGPAVVPGKLAESPLIAAISYDSDDRQMPPEGKLPATEIAALRRWVEMGAPWPKEDGAPVVRRFDLAERRASHWSWQPIARPEPPPVRDSSWPRDTLDWFILAKLEAASLAPAPDAERRTLLRRVYFDLIGLPPTPEDIAAFLSDDSVAAFERVVDRLLASPRFGERWARHWLDLARYTETYGHQYDYEIRHPWRYRDYVIRALNADLPYDEFVREHVAGDLLESPRRHPTDGYNESVIATGFWHFYEQHRAPTDVRQYQADCVDNQIDVMSKAFLGLTVACARCHDHKFDAISTKDYYALANILKSTRQQDAPLDPGGKIGRAVATIEDLRGQGQRILQDLVPRPSDGARKEFAEWLLYAHDVATGQTLERIAAENQLNFESFARWSQALGDAEVQRPGHPLYAWNVMSRAEDAAGARTHLTLDYLKAERIVGDPALDWVARADRGDFANWSRTGWAFGGGPTASGQWNAAAGRLSVDSPGAVDSGSLALKLRGVVRSPNFTIAKKSIHIRARGERGRVRVVIDNFLIDEISNLLFAGLIQPVKDKDQFQWITIAGDLPNHLGHRAHLVFEDDGDGFVEVDAVVQSDGPPPADEPNRLLAKAVSRPETAAVAALADAYGEVWNETLARFHAGTLDAEHAALLNWTLASGLIDTSGAEGKLAEIAAAIRDCDEALPAPLYALATTDGTTVEDPVSLRGRHQQPGDAVPRRFLEALGGVEHPIAGPGSGRVELARQMVSRDNPYTARVAVNRIWHHLLGRGIVATVDNFGVQGRPPTHPELLDYLADELVRDGWSQKRLIRRIVLSRTYQMASRSPTREIDAADPLNLLWHRAQIRRLEGEAIRDSLLAVSGELNDKMYGRPVPLHLTPFMDGRGRPSKSGPLDGDGRRTVYLAVRRNFLSPMLLAFDAPLPFTAVGQRNVSNVPAQALMLLNDPLVIELSRRWAADLMGGSPEEPRAARIGRMVERAWGRPATPDEIAAMSTFLDEQARLYGVAADQLGSNRDVWADLAHVIFNAKEFIFLQ